MTTESVRHVLALLEKAEAGSRELDGEIALACGIFKVWLSKHRYWTFEAPGGRRFIWPDSGISEYDSATGKKIVLTDKPWPSWVWHAHDLPEFSTSLDAALTLVPEEHWWSAGDCKREKHARVCKEGADHDGHEGFGATVALALCIASLKARRVSGAAEGD